MSSNSSGISGSSDPFEALTSPFYRWLENDVFPVVVGVTILLMLIIGIILNSFLVHAIRRKRLEISSGRIYLISLIVLDFVAYFSILFPSLIVSFAKDWILSDFVCIVSGDLVTGCLLMTFYLQLIIFIERWMKISGSDLYDKTLGRNKVSIIIIVCLWVVFLFVGILPLTGWGVLEYISYEHLCNIKHTDNIIGMNLLFIFAIYIPSVLSIVFLILIVRKRKNILNMLSELQTEVDVATKKINKFGKGEVINNNHELIFERENICRLSRETTEALSVSHIDTTNSRLEIAPEIEVLSTEIIQNCDLPGSTTSRSEAEIQGELFPLPLSNEKTNADHATLIEHVYEKSEEHMDIHLTVTYTIMWGVALVMWIPYVIVCYLDAYASFSMWGGWYSMVVPITHMTYVMKPIIYLSHNKVFRDAAYQTIPENVRTRAQKVRKVLKNTMNKMDEFVFPQRKRSVGIEESDIKKQDRNEMKTFSTFKTTKSKRNNETRF